VSSIATLEALMSQRHVEWERQAASADQRQIELFHSQCALIRDQVGVLSRSLMAVKGEVQGLQRSESQVLARLEAEVAQRQELSRRVESEVLQRLDLSSRLSAACNELHELSGNFTDTCDKLTAKSYALRETEEAAFAEQERLRAEFRALHQEVSQASDTRISRLVDEASQLVAGERAAAAKVAALAARDEALDGQLKMESQRVGTLEEVSQMSDARIAELAAALEGEKNGRGAALDELSSALGSLRLDLEREVGRRKASGTQLAEEIRSSLRSLQDVLDEEVKACAAGHQDAKSSALQAQHLVEEQAQELSAVLAQGELNECWKREAASGSAIREEEQAIMQSVDGLRQVLSQEVNEHAVVMRQLRAHSDDFRCNLDKLQMGSDESSTALHHMNARLEAERRERVNFVAKMPDQFAALSQALGTHVKTLLEEVTERLEHRCTALGQEFMQERAERANEHIGLRRILRGLEERVQALAAVQSPSTLR